MQGSRTLAGQVGLGIDHSSNSPMLSTFRGAYGTSLLEKQQANPGAYMVYGLGLGTLGFTVGFT